MREDINIWKRISAGIKDGRKAFCGPHTVQIDLTDKCNSTCIGCWVHSPLIGRKEVFAKNEKQLPFRKVKKLIKDLSGLRIREVILSGSGEPFLYPEIKEVIKIIKSKGMYLNIITNATLINEEIAMLLVKCKVDLITASIWAGDSAVYALTHPEKTAIDFEKITNNLTRLAFYKKKGSSLKPHLKLYNVICSKNCNNIENMVEFAKQVDGDSVEFQVIDIIPGETDSLSLAGDDKERTIKQLKEIREQNSLIPFNTPRGTALSKYADEEFLDFGKIWKNHKAGFYVDRYCNSLVCKEGRNIANKRIILSESTSTTDTRPVVFWYKFKSRVCKDCGERNACLDKKMEIDIKLLNMLGIGSFLRRLFYSNLEKGIYEKQINTIPCYMGWYYARILTDGSVVPCCKAEKFPLGNLYEADFPKIWHSPLYEEFRSKAKSLPKSDKYFSKLNCIKSCDNWGMNLKIHKRFKQEESAKAGRINTAHTIGIKAKNFIRGNLNANCRHSFGKGIVIDGGTGGSYAEYGVWIAKMGKYSLYAKYACDDFRPVDIYIDNKLIKKDGLACVTGGWTSKYLKWNKEVDIVLDKGEHILRIQSRDVIPHIEKFIITKKERLVSIAVNEVSSSYFSFIKKIILKKGFKTALKKIRKNLKMSYLKDRYLEMLGIYDKEYGYKGPFHVQIDLTNNCNNSCIACWCNSPLFKVPRLSKEEKEQYLPLEMVKELLDEISCVGATEVYFSGSGEPFMHPQIMEVLEYTKRKNLICHVNTNFTLLNKERLDRLINIGVDFLTVSTWAATADTYVKTHPGRSSQDFYKIKENLIYLNSRKKDKPYIKLYNVIFNMNYFEAQGMVEFAGEIKAESLEFTVVDTMPGATDTLSLNEAQLKQLHGSCIEIQSRLDKQNKFKKNGVLIFQFDQFLRRISVSSDAKQAKYDRNIIDNMPCYIGWLFARVIPNGQVHSCLKAHRIPTGSLYLNRFFEIWNSEKQEYFRNKTLTYKKDDPFFRLIGNDPKIEEAGCYKSCDDIGRNTWMHNRMQLLSFSEKVLLRCTANILKIARKLIFSREKSYMEYDKNPVIAGIIHGRRAFTGPEQVVVDITNRCSLKCISCWLYSPLLNKDKPSQEWLGKELPKDRLFRLIEDLASLGTKKIRFTGGGEPFIYADLMEIIEFAREKQLQVAITTNFGLVSKKQIKKLIDLNLEELCVSIWASTPKIYSQVHPGTSFAYFEKLKENLFYLKETRRNKPRITFANVMMSSNHHDFKGMYEFGLQYGADALYFTIADVFAGQTDKLAMNDEERKNVLNNSLEIKERSKKDNIHLEFFDGFLSRLAQSDADFRKGQYDRFTVDQIPCYAGWTFTRVLADGNIVPCCRGVKKIMGNINNKLFEEIWFSDQYNEFRSKAKYLPKSNVYFNDIACAKECDNLMHNQTTHKIITSGGAGKREP
ncbi:MAG: radical SAM protein [Candidatus Omnitrophota bacterium]